MLVTPFCIVTFKKLVAIVLTIGGIEKVAPRRLVVIGSVEGVVFRKLIAIILMTWGVKVTFGKLTTIVLTIRSMEGVPWPFNDFCALASTILIYSFIDEVKNLVYSLNTKLLMTYQVPLPFSCSIHNRLPAHQIQTHR